VLLAVWQLFPNYLLWIPFAAAVAQRHFSIPLLRPLLNGFLQLLAAPLAVSADSAAGIAAGSMLCCHISPQLG
jgi:hypothetical protein